MKNGLIKAYIFTCCLLCGGPFLFAENQSNKANDTGVVAGLNFPMYKDSGEGVVVGLTYSNWTSRGLGFRTGFQYTSNVARVDNVFGIPVAVAFRTKQISTADRLRGGMESAASSVSQNWGNSGSDQVRGAFFNFLAALFSDVEFYAGVTPGYVAGNSSPIRESSYLTSQGSCWEKSWTELNYRFTTSLDAGLNLNYGIWRFDLKIMPAFHFNITDNYILHTSEGNSTEGETRRSTQHARWFFTINFGLAFNF